MTRRDRVRYHQLHPAKLLTDWGTAVLAGGLLWRGRPLMALAVGVGPSVAVTWILLSGRLDRELERVRSMPVAQRIAPQLSPAVDALRLGGLALFWAGAWLHQAWLLPAGLSVIAGGWWLAWRRGAVPVAPPHVSIILDGEVRLEGLTPELREALTRRSFRVTRDLWGHSAIPFDPRPGDPADNSQLVRILEALAGLGFAFASDFKQAWSPEATLLHLRERGLFRGAFLACGFDGSRWHVREISGGLSEPAPSA